MTDGILILDYDMKNNDAVVRETRFHDFFQMFDNYSSNSNAVNGRVLEQDALPA